MRERDLDRVSRRHPPEERRRQHNVVENVGWNLSRLGLAEALLEMLPIAREAEAEDPEDRRGEHVALGRRTKYRADTMPSGVNATHVVRQPYFRTEIHAATLGAGSASQRGERSGRLT